MKFPLLTALLISLLSKAYYGQYNPFIDYYGQYPDYGIGQNPYYPEPREPDPAELLRGFVENAKSMLGSEQYTRDSKYKIGKKKDKCHVFVYDVINETGGHAPQNFPWFALRATPIPANIWQNQRSMFIMLTGHFAKCKGDPAAGDIIACKGHVGIVTGRKRTTLADPEANPRGLINETDWGFRKGQKPACWRYK